MSERTTEIHLGGNLRMTLAHDARTDTVRYTAGVYRRLRGSPHLAGIAIAGAEHAHLVLHPQDDAASLWIGATKFSVPLATAERIETFFQIRASRGKGATP